MRVAMCVLVAACSLSAFPAAAQGWIEYLNEDEMFGINMPHEPAVE